MPLIDRDASGGLLTIRWALKHPVTATWLHLCEPSRLGEWIGEPIQCASTVGGLIEINHGEGYVCRSIVKKCDPERHSFVVSWQFPDEHDTEVAIAVGPLQERLHAAQLILSHRDLGELLDSYADGWVTHLTFFEASLNGATLPPEAFWDIHATIQALRQR